jgi:plastocyanin domain-containing protein
MLTFPLVVLARGTTRFNRLPGLAVHILGVLMLTLLVACSGAGAEGPLVSRVEMSVTEKGFEPQNIRVKKGELVTLIITRKTDTTCATEIVIDEHKIKTPLPLNKAVTVTFTPSKTGTLKYGCAMNKMIGGVITII